MIIPREQVARWIEEDRGIYRDKHGRYVSRKVKIQPTYTVPLWVYALPAFAVFAFLHVVGSYIISIVEKF
jgi:hypothetical protein